MRVTLLRLVVKLCFEIERGKLVQYMNVAPFRLHHKWYKWTDFGSVVEIYRILYGAHHIYQRGGSHDAGPGRVIWSRHDHLHL